MSKTLRYGQKYETDPARFNARMARYTTPRRTVSAYEASLSEAAWQDFKRQQLAAAKPRFAAFVPNIPPFGKRIPTK